MSPVIQAIKRASRCRGGHYRIGRSSSSTLRRNLDGLGRDTQLLALHGAAFLKTPLVTLDLRRLIRDCYLDTWIRIARFTRMFLIVIVLARARLAPFVVGEAIALHTLSILFDTMGSVIGNAAFGHDSGERLLDALESFAFPSTATSGGGSNMGGSNSRELRPHRDAAHSARKPGVLGGCVS